MKPSDFYFINTGEINTFIDIRPLTRLRLASRSKIPTASKKCDLVFGVSQDKNTKAYSYYLRYEVTTPTRVLTSKWAVCDKEFVNSDLDFDIFKQTWMSFLGGIVKSFDISGPKSAVDNFIEEVFNTLRDDNISINVDVSQQLSKQELFAKKYAVALDLVSNGDKKISFASFYQLKYLSSLADIEDLPGTTSFIAFINSLNSFTPKFRDHLLLAKVLKDDELRDKNIELLNEELSITFDNFIKGYRSVLKLDNEDILSSYIDEFYQGMWKQALDLKTRFDFKIDDNVRLKLTDTNGVLGKELFVF